MNQSTKDPKTLNVRACVNQLPMLADDDPQFLKLLASVRADGVRDEITLDQNGDIVDGRHRAKAAALEHRPTVPVSVRGFASDREALDFAVARLFERRHYTDSARAYTVAKMEAPTLLRAAKVKRLVHLKNVQIPHESSSGGNPPHDDEKGRASERMAASHGFSGDRWKQAMLLIHLFDDHPKFVDEFEPQILSGEKNLGWVICAIQGRVTPENNKGRSDGRVEAFPALTDWVRIGAHRFKNYWPKMRSQSQRLLVAEQFASELVAVLPSEVISSVEKKLKARREANR